jgi:hypothetical protein
MLAVTNILRPPPARIGSLSEDLIFPRTVEVRKLIAVVIGATAGLFVWTFPIGLFTGYSVLSLLVVSALFGVAGLAAVSWSPIRGESLAVWLGLSTETLRAERVRIEGRKVRAYLGVAPLPFTAAGMVRMLPGAITVPAGSVDERGVPVSGAAMLESFRAEAGELPPMPFTGFEDSKQLPNE